MAARRVVEETGSSRWWRLSSSSIRNIKMDDVSPLPLHNEDKTPGTRALPSSSVRILWWFWCRVGYILSCRSLLPAHLCSCCSVLFLNWLIIRRVFRFVDELSCSHVCDSSEEKEELLFFFSFLAANWEQTSGRSLCYFSCNCIFGTIIFRHCTQ